MALRIASYLAPNLREVYAAAASAIEEALGEPVAFQDQLDYSLLADYDAAFLCSVPYLDAGSGSVAVAAPVPIGDRYSGRPVYFSDVIVAADSGIESFDDLRGRSWAYNEPRSWSGYWVTLEHLADAGTMPGFFARVEDAGFHETAIHRVVDGAVDASAIDSVVLDQALRTDPSLAERIRVIDSWGPNAIQPLVVAARMTGDRRAAIERAVIAMHTVDRFASVLEAHGIARFVAVPDDHYDRIARTMAELRARGFASLDR